MIGATAATLRRLGDALLDPARAMRVAAVDASPAALVACLMALLAALGCATLPRQLALADARLAFVGDPLVDARQWLMRGALVRVMLADRLVPAPTVLLAAVLLAVVADPVFSLARDRRRLVAAVVCLGLAPLIVQRVGELALTYLVPGSALPTAGDAVSLPSRFATGAKLLWPRDAPAPVWLEVLDARLNVITLWCAALWVLGLRALDGGRLAPWHVALPVACLAGGGLLSWILGPPALALVVGSP